MPKLPVIPTLPDDIHLTVSIPATGVNRFGIPTQATIEAYTLAQSGPGIRFTIPSEALGEATEPMGE